MKSAESFAKGSKFLSLASVCIVVTALYFASSVLIPLALGVLFAFLLAPMASRLERVGLRRAFASVLVVALGLVVVGMVGWMISSQVTDLAGDIPKYRTQIVERIHAVEQHFRGGSIAEASHAVAEMAQEVSNPATQPSGERQGTAGQPMEVTITSPPSAGILGALSDVLALLAPMAQFILVVAVAAFFLVGRDDLRDRLLRLMGQGQLTVTTQALDEAAQRVSRYLLSQTLVNGCYAVVVGVVLYFIGIPNAALWGLLCGLLRFIPYVGIWIGAAFPILISAILPTESPIWFIKPSLTLGLFVGLELLVANVFEPVLYGSSTGVSAVAIIVAAVFWTWLWGAAGLVLSTPLTVCLAVAGKYMPQLQFLHILLGDEPVLLPSERFYQRLLADDSEQARELVDEMAKTESLEKVYDTMLIPALHMAARDAAHGVLEEKRLTSMQLAIQEIVEDRRAEEVEKPVIAEEFRIPRDTNVKVLILPAQDRSDEIAGGMLAHLLEQRGYEARAVSSDMLASEMVVTTGHFEADIVCISALPPGAVSHSRYLCKRLREKNSELRLLVGLWGTHGDMDKTKRRIACSPTVSVVASMAEALEGLRQMSHGVLIRGETPA